MPKPLKTLACLTCGHDVAGPPPKDVRLTNRCFTCLAGQQGLLAIEFKKQRARLWDALSDILEEPALAIPPKLRRAGIRAIQSCNRADFKRRTT